jgi:hypothetical protein
LLITTIFGGFERIVVLRTYLSQIIVIVSHLQTHECKFGPVGCFRRLFKKFFIARIEYECVFSNIDGILSHTKLKPRSEPSIWRGGKQKFEASVISTMKNEEEDLAKKTKSNKRNPRN